MQTDKPFEERFDRAQDDYASILQFAKETSPIRYSSFDASTVRRLNLFALRENFDFEVLEETLDKILKTLPAIKRVFARPITRLKDTSEIMPVESVRVVNNRTIVHASAHSELWDDISEDGLKPRKLLTLNYQDNYSIYENIAFVKAIDIILHLVRRNIRILRDMLYANGNLHFNILERENHLQHFLAIGKLHIGYVRDYDKYRPLAERCLNKLLFIEEVVGARLGSPVYKQCKRKAGKITLKKTNIFRGHKDYHRIYLLLKWFADTKIGDWASPEEAPGESGEGYGLYCSMLSLFAAGHFNFVFPEEQLIDYFRLDTECTFQGWKLKLETVSCDDSRGIRLTFTKDRSYSVILIPTLDPGWGRVTCARFKEFHKADAYLQVTPVEGVEDTVYLSLYDIESFRRIQQILLRGMIASDSSRDICPFCGNRLTKSEEYEEVYECGVCRTQILQLSCPKTNGSYVATAIKNHRLPERTAVEAMRRDKLLYNRYIESLMHFRNITAIGEGAGLICPECQKIHFTGANSK